MTVPGTTQEVLDEFAPTSWSVAPKPFVLELASGQKCLVRKLGMEDIIKLDMLDDLDTFTPQLLPPEAEGKPKTAVSSIRESLGSMADSSKFGKLESTINKVTIACVLKPKVLPIPLEGEEREEGRAYVDYISFGDKMYIFGEVFEGMSDMESFREEQTTSVELPPDVEGNGSSSEPPSGVVVG